MSKVYVKKEARQEDLRSSAFAFLLVGAIGCIFTILFATQLIAVAVSASLRLLYSIVIGAISILFLIVGILSLHSSKKVASQIVDEQNMEEEILKNFDHNFVYPDTQACSTEDIYFVRNQAIQAFLLQHYPSLKEEYQEYISEIIYQHLFEK